MTDDRLEKVRAEVERRKELHEHELENTIHQGFWLEKIIRAQIREDFWILSFIDSIQEETEHRFEVGQTITDPDDSTFTFHINKIEDGKYIESDDAWVLIKDADEEYQLVEESVSEDFEKVLEDKIREAQCWTYIEEEGCECPIYQEFGADDLEKFARWGAEWQKQKIMKDAVDGEVGECYPTTIHLDKDISELKHFDKVKLIIIMGD